MPESFRAFWRMVSLTAAKTSRIFDVSVACVRLDMINTNTCLIQGRCHLLRIQIEVCPIHLVESPQEVLRRPVDVVTTRVVREVIAQGRFRKFRSEEIDFVQEQDDGCSHEPSRVDHRVEEHEGLHHSVLFAISIYSLRCALYHILDCFLPKALDRIHSMPRRR